MCDDSPALGRMIAQSPRPIGGLSVVLASFLLAAIASSAYGGTIRHDRDDALYLDLAADAAFDPVGKFTWNEPGFSYLASGTLIRDDWVLTAGHVVGGTDGLGAGVTNMKFFVGGATYTADQWIPHDQWSASGESLTAGWDIGLVHLATDVNSVTPADLYLPEYGSELGLVGTEVGFGATGTGSTGYQENTAGTKRAGQNILDVVGTAETSGTPNNVFNHSRLMAVDFDNAGGGFLNNPYGSGTPLNLEYLTAPGDSGGGLFVDVEGEMKLAGVTSYISAIDFNVNSDYGDIAGFTRVSKFIDWIDDTIGPEVLAVLFGDYNGNDIIDAADYTVWRDAMTAGGTELPNDSTPGTVDESDYLYWRDHFGETLGSGAGQGSRSPAVPEPGSLALLLCGGLTAAAARTR